MADISNYNQLARLPQSNESGPHEIAHAISARMERQRRRSCSRRAREEGPSSPLRKEKICPIRLPSSTATYALPASCQRHHLPRPGCNMQACCNTDRCNPNGDTKPRHPSHIDHRILMSCIKSTDSTQTFGVVLREYKS